MRFLLPDHYRTARQSLDRARLRTLLTILGVAIGVASITAILALAGGVRTTVNRQITGLGDNVALVRPTPPEASLADLSNPTPSNAYSTSPIEERDVETIRQLPGTETVAPLMTISGGITSSEGSSRQHTILATTPDFKDIDGIVIEDGDFIDAQTRQNTVVIGSQLSIDVYGTEQSVGKRMTIRGQVFTVIGVLKRTNEPINYNNVDLDRTAIISLTSGKLFNGGVAQIQQINILAQDGTDMRAFERSIDQALDDNHQGESNTSTYTGKAIAEPTNNLFGVVSAVMTVIAGISLVVGGVGIMNIMLVGVSERTREIGLRKAVGASNVTIVSQFMIEALIISVLGGLIGFIGGYFLAFVVSMFIPYDPTFAWSIVGWAAALSIGVGVMFGLYPAVKAARKDPIESLRRYH